MDKVVLPMDTLLSGDLRTLVILLHAERLGTRCRYNVYPQESLYRSILVKIQLEIISSTSCAHTASYESNLPTIIYYLCDTINKIGVPLIIHSEKRIILLT